MPEENTCRLCKCQKTLQESHIVPAFVCRWQKRTSSTGYLRFGQQMNRRVQDGLKTPLLCEECEGRFNAWETRFANEFFLPFHDEGQTTFDYEIWMSKFCVSVSWRVLAYMEDRWPDADFAARYGADAGRALSVWEDFLLDKRPDVGDFEQHLLPLSAIESVDGELPNNIQRYLMRAVEIDRLRNNQSAFTFAKLGHVVLMGFIREPEAKLWKGSRIETGTGSIAPARLELPDWLLATFMQRAERLAELQAELSARQQEKIDTTQRADKERVLRSETFGALLEDHRLAAMTPPTPDCAATIERLCRKGDPRETWHWPKRDPDYVTEFGLRAEHIPALVDLARQWAEASDRTKDETLYAPIHAWRALAQLQAVEAVEPLLAMQNHLDEEGNDWYLEEFHDVFGLVGPPAVPALAGYLANRGNREYPRISAANGLCEVGKRHPEARQPVVEALTGQLAKHEREYSLNGFLVGYLADLKAEESAEVIERAFAAGVVDESICGHWTKIRQELGVEELGLVPDRPEPSGRFGPVRFFDQPSSMERPARDRQREKDRRAKTKRKQQAKARKRNRKRR